MTDTSIVQILLKDNFSDLYEALKESGGLLYLNNAINKWLLSLFFQGVSEMYSLFIWDMLLLEGNIIIFKTIYAMMIILENYIVKCKTMDQLNRVFNEVPLKFDKRAKLAYYLISKKFNFNMNIIKKYRKTLNPQIVKEIMDAFYRDDEISEDNKDLIEEKPKIICDLDWPLCLKDKKNLEKSYDYIVLKQLNEPNILDNYIDNYEEYKILKKKDKINDEKEDEVKYFKEKRFEDLIIERKMHFCDSKLMSIRDKLYKSSLNFEQRKREEIPEIQKRKISAEFNKKDFDFEKANFEKTKTINQIAIDVANFNKDKIVFVKENVEKGLINDD